MRQNATWNDGVGESSTAWIVVLIERGFTAKDIIEILIFGFDEVTPGPEGLRCMRVVDEFYCANGLRLPVDTEPDDVDDSASELDPAESDESIADPEPEVVESGERLEFSGPFAVALGLAPEPGDTVLTDLFFASTDGPEALLTGRGAILGQSGESIFSGDSDTTCIYASIDFELASVGSYEWAGTVTFGVYAEGGACPLEGFPIPTESVQAEATASFDGSELSLDFTAEDETYTIIASRSDPADS